MEEKRMRVTKRTLRAVLEQCQQALELLQDAQFVSDESTNTGGEEEVQEATGGSDSDELCELLKSKVESPNFLDKLGRSYIAVSDQTPDESAAWDMINATDFQEDNKHIESKDESEDNGFVLVKQEDIVDGIANFMAAYLSSMKQTKELTPDQLQKALCKTFSLKKKKSKLRRAWDRSTVVYNVASWSATAFGMYKNPAVFRAASAAFWSSCHVVSKLL